VDVSIFTDLVTKYKALLLDNPEAFILVFASGCIATWFIIHARVGNAQAEVKSKKAEIEALERHMALHRDRAEHYKARIDALELQQLRTSTPPGFEKSDTS